MRFIFMIVFVVICISFVTSDPVRYDNFTLLTMYLNPWDKVDHLEVEFWSRNTEILSYPHNNDTPFKLIIPPDQKQQFLQVLKEHDVPYKILNENIQELIDEERRENEMAARAEENYGWTRFYNYEETTEWMKALPKKYPDQVTAFSIGKTHHNRDTYGVKLSKRPNNPAIFIEAGIHAREWISPATSTYIFNQLLTSNDPRMKTLSENYDWYVVPITNPDGYFFTQVNRMWRKNLRRNQLCYGVDLNRNWDYHWNEAGTSTFPCSDIYSGSKPLSEIETQNLANFVRSIANDVKLYISFHSYSQLLLWPEGHTGERIPEHDDYSKIGKATVNAIEKRYGTKYTMGSINEAIYPASGGSIDWMRSVLKIPLAFCFELRPSRNSDGIGFILPPSEIITNGEEVLDGVVAMVDSAQALGYFKM